MDITIGLRWVSIPGAHNVYCGRGSVFGNPFAMRDKSTEERDRVCNAYVPYFSQQIANPNSPLRQGMLQLVELARTGISINLQCYCAPKRCHCETIRECLINTLSR